MSLPSKTLCLFDVDGTLTQARQVITPDMKEFLLNKVAPKCPVALVGGSDVSKIQEQMGSHEVTSSFDYVFAENGLYTTVKGQLVESQSIQNHIGDEKLQEFINFCLRYMSELTLPVKRGTFVEFRTGMINICPVGRSCSQEERINFFEYDKTHHVREKFIAAIKKQFPDLGLQYSIGGQISFDVFPPGWDKTYCLKFLDSYKVIHFFGDKTQPGGNDYEIFSHPRTIGHTVTGPDDTKMQLKSLLGIGDD